MTREPIPEELRRFLLTSVPSVPFVEAFLLYRASRDDPLPLPEVAARLYLAETAASDVVQQLVNARVVAFAGRPDSHRYAPHSKELTLMLELLAAYYRTHLVEVTDLLHSKSERKAQHFADAFKWRKES